MNELATFWAGCLDEEEAAARAYVPVADLTHRHGHGKGWREHNHLAGNRPHQHDLNTDGQIPAVTVGDPARVLREVEAGRAILARYEDCLARMEDPDYPAGVARDQAREYEDFVIPNLIAVYSDHPDYRAEFAP